MNAESFLNERQTAIAALRATGTNDLEARLLLEDTLCQLETWLDPQIAIDRREQQAAERARFRAIVLACHEMAEDIDPVCQF
jgi:hypothetical protein